MKTDNPFAQPPHLYVWQMQASAVTEALIEGIFSSDAVLSVSSDVLDGHTSVCIYTEEREGSERIHSHLAAVELATGVSFSEIHTEAVVEKDWVLETQAAIRPQIIGAFAVLGSHHTDDDLPHGKILVRMDAGAAFGTGEHGTTSGCLLALTQIAKQQKMRCVLDMGCGTAILGMAAAQLQPCQVIAVDNDAVAVRVARENIRKNRLSSQVKALCSEGFRDPRVTDGVKYDVVIANILARPVREMACDVAACLAPHGRVVLSGFYARDIAFVLARYKLVGLALERKIIRNNWATLVLRRLNR
jgi:ribosomal protein L11 methyltransferase